MNNQATTSMEPLSARIPTDLYLWLAQLQLDGATTNSDKLRVLLTQLKRQHDGAFDYVAAHEWARDATQRFRMSLVRTDGATGQHSAVLNSVLDFLVGAMAVVVSNAPQDVAQCAQLEDVLVKKTFALCDALLRQGMTQSAPAYDADVINRNMKSTIELASAIHTLHTSKGASNGG